MGSGSSLPNIQNKIGLESEVSSKHLASSGIALNVFLLCGGWISSLQYSRHDSQYIQQLQTHIRIRNNEIWGGGVVGVMIFLSLDTIPV